MWTMGRQDTGLRYQRRHPSMVSLAKAIGGSIHVGLIIGTARIVDAASTRDFYSVTISGGPNRFDQVLCYIGMAGAPASPRRRTLDKPSLFGAVVLVINYSSNP
jgi:hypothetical protein